MEVGDFVQYKGKIYNIINENIDGTYDLTCGIFEQQYRIQPAELSLKFRPGFGKLVNNDRFRITRNRNTRTFWIARDANEGVKMFVHRPHLREDGSWEVNPKYQGYEDITYIEGELFPEITYQNSPRKINIEL
jgi:hypothetical protein